MTNNSKEVLSALYLQRNFEKASVLSRFFKTGVGEYGYGDMFWGIAVPQIREVVQTFYKNIALIEIEKLLKHQVHEVRLCAVLLLVKQFAKANEQVQQKIFNIYINNIKYINNWDLVDLSAPNIVGQYLLNKDKSLLYVFAKSESLWERRIAIIATFTFIRRNDFKDTLAICEILIQDKQDLIHKACGWMLREIYKRHSQTIINFLNTWQKVMPRVALRYAIEKMPEAERQAYLLTSKNKHAN